MGFKIGEAFVEVTAEDNTDRDTSSIGRSLTTWAGSLGLGALIGSQINAGLNIETGRATLQNQLGLTAADAAEYGNLAGSVYRDNYGESLEEVNGVIGQVGTALGGLSDTNRAEIQDMTGEILTLADTFNLDATTSITNLSSAVSNGLAPSLRDATDIATRVFQEGGPKAEEFLDVIGEYGPNLSAAGISMQEFGAMSVSYLDAGGFSVDQFADSIRELTIRVADGSAASSGAFESLGLNAEDMTAKMAAGGPAAQEAFSTIVASLNGITDPVAQNTAGAQLFGSMWEDSSGAILAGLSPLPDALGDVAGATDEMTQVAGGTGASRIESYKRSIAGWLTQSAELPGPLGAISSAVQAVGIESVTSAVGVASMVGSFIMSNRETITNTISTVANTVAKGAQATATGIATGAQWLWNAALSANPIALVVIAIAALVAGLVWFFTQTEIGRDIITAVWGAIQAAIGATVSWITDTVVPALGNAWQWVVDKALWIRDMYFAIWTAIGNAILSAVSWIRDTVTSIVSTVVNFLSNAWNGALNTVRSVFGAIGGFIGNTISTIVSTISNLPGNIISMFANAGSWLLNAGRNVVTGLWNGISGAASWLWGRIRSWAGGIVDSVLGALGIASPSRVMRDMVGRYIPEGVAVGMDENTGFIEDAADRMRDAATPDMYGPSMASGTFDAGLVGRAGQTGMVAETSTGAAITIGNLTLQVEGKFDFSNPVEWERFIEAVRAGLVNVERAYS